MQVGQGLLLHSKDSSSRPLLAGLGAAPCRQLCLGRELSHPGEKGIFSYFVEACGLYLCKLQSSQAARPEATLNRKIAGGRVGKSCTSLLQQGGLARSVSHIWDLLYVGPHLELHHQQCDASGSLQLCLPIKTIPGSRVPFLPFSCTASPHWCTLWMHKKTAKQTADGGTP